MKLAIGIDTGGTCTDAILYDFETGKVLGQNKALTTYDDLTRGILESLDGLDPALCRKATVAGLSTTLATNACVEGKFRRTRLLLMGIDRRGVDRFGAEYGFTDPDDVRYLPCKTTITGQIIEEPDWDALRANAREWFADVEGCAVCEIYGMRNGGVLEQKAAEIIREKTGLPVVCASELFSGLSSFLDEAAQADEIQQSAHQTAAQALASYLAGLISKAGLFAVSFLVILLVWFLVSHILDLAFHLPILSTVNLAGGLILGLLKAALLILVLVWLGQLAGLIPDHPDTPVLSLFTPRRVGQLLDQLLV